MIQEYLFVSNKNLEEAKAYKPEGIKTTWTQMENTDNWIVSYSLPRESFENAKRLSDLNLFVTERYNPTVLVNDSAALYNKRLYPIVNEFERLLRKTLYLKGTLHQGEKAVANLKNLEEQEFGKLFDLLFADDDFIKEVKERVNSKSWKYSKNEILESIQKLSENTLWDLLFTEPHILRERFVEVRKYRNAVMHAHNIDTDTYDNAKNLFLTINKELLSETNRIVKQKDELVDYSEVIHNAITVQKKLEIEPDIVRLRNFIIHYAPKDLSEVYERFGYDYKDMKQLEESLHRYFAMSNEQKDASVQEEPRKKAGEA